VLAYAQTGRLIATAAIVATVAVAWIVGALLARRSDDEFTSFHVRRVVRYLSTIVGAVAIVLVWRVFHGHGTVVVGFVVAGLTFALQEVVGAVAGWFNIVTGRIYRVGDRIEIAGVHGDVIDISLLRTKLLEFGAEQAAADPTTSTWVRGRQYTGRIVAFSNKTTFTEPTFNYSGIFDVIWEEVTVPVGYGTDWKLAEQIMLEEAQRAASGEEAEAAVQNLQRRYPVPAAEVEPRIFVHLTDNYVELAARFTVPVRKARTVKSEMSRRVLERFAEAGLQVASTNMDVTIYQREFRPRRDE
jgi:small-conductance mechanosensitive channel